MNADMRDPDAAVTMREPSTTSVDDTVVPFAVEALDLRGRVVRLGPAVDSILRSHAYPVPVAKLLGEAIVLTILLGSVLKFEGRFILQTQSDGPVRMLVVDYTTPGKVRALASFDRGRLAAAMAERNDDAGALLRHQARNLLTQAARSILHANFWKCSGKNLAIEHFLVTTARAIDYELPFFFRCAERRIPVGFPIGRRLGRHRKATRTYKPPACCHNPDVKPYCSFHR